MSDELTRFRDVDAEVVQAAKDIKILSQIAWPPELAQEFLAGWHAGRPELPKPPPVEVDLHDHMATLERLSVPVADHPAAAFIARTAHSYLEALQMLEAAGTPAFTELSTSIYGRPNDGVAPGGLTSLRAAIHFDLATRELGESCFIDDADASLTAEDVAARMRPELDAFFTHHRVEVTVDPSLAAKAAAGAQRIRLRAGALFSEDDIVQLLNHEGFVHSATLLNGRNQPHLACLSLGAPRTTCTQEGLATFSELITTSIDLARLRRLALRIIAVHEALSGADFIDVFKLFLEKGQSELESYQSAMRVFRGGDVRGRVAFTKDAVYLRGLLKTHAWLHSALGARKVQYPHYIFAGRLTWGDAEELEPCFESGLIAPPLYEPRWVARRNNLAAYLSFSSLTHDLPISEVELAHFATRRFRALEADGDDEPSSSGPSAAGPGRPRSGAGTGRTPG